MESQPNYDPLAMTRRTGQDIAQPLSQQDVRSRRRGIEPFDLLLIVVTIAAAIAVIDPVYDVNDLFWHLLIGDEIRAGVPWNQLGATFSFGLENRNWRTGAWGSEALLSWLYDTGGWLTVIYVVRLGTIAGVCLVLWRFVLLRFPARASALPYFLAMVALALTVQERPQSISFIFLTMSGVWWYQATVEARTPSWLLVGIVCAVWANLHGLWVLLPAVLLLALLGRLLDHGVGDSQRLRLGAAFLAAVIGGLVTPLGVSGLLLAFEIRNSASAVIAEWQVTQLYGSPGFLLLIAAGLSIFLVGRLRAPRSQVLYVVTISFFGLMAVRNVAPAILLLVPISTALISQALGSHAQPVVGAREASRLKIAAWGLVAAGLATVPVTMLVRDQGVPRDLPIALVQELAAEPERVRLFNDYNLSGIALFYGGPQVQVAVDGRADYYGGAYLDRYQDAVLYGRDLDELVDELAPTHALLQTNSAASTILQERGWDEVASTADHVLLDAP